MGHLPRLTNQTRTAGIYMVCNLVGRPHADPVNLFIQNTLWPIGRSILIAKDHGRRPDQAVVAPTIQGMHIVFQRRHHDHDAARITVLKAVQGNRAEDRDAQRPRR